MGIFTLDTRDPNARAFDPELGEYLLGLFRDHSWLLRRIESIELIELRTARWRVTVDIDVPALCKRSEHVPKLNQQHMHLAPIATVRKDLLINLDVRDESFSAVPLPTREDDSYAAFSLLTRAAQRALKTESVHSRVQSELYEIAYNFPHAAHASDVAVQTALARREREVGWERQAQSQWSSLQQHATFAELLRIFRKSFLFLSLVPSNSGTRILKFAYETPLRPLPWTYLQKLGVRASKVVVELPAIGHGRSHHIRFAAPPGLVLTDAQLFEISSEEEESPRIYHRKLNRTQAHIYVSEFPKKQNAVIAAFALRAPYPGFARMAFLSTVFNAVVLLLVWSSFGRLSKLVTSQADAAVSLLLIFPSILSAFVIRPKEHDLVVRVLRWTRASVGITALLPYVAACILFIRPFTPSIQRGLLLSLTILASAQAAVLAIVRSKTTRAVNEVATSEALVQPATMTLPPEGLTAEFMAGQDSRSYS